MDSYINIMVLPDPEMRETLLINNLFAKLHRALVQHKIDDIGVSFPNHAKTLGNVLRLHGKGESLQAFMVEPWLKGLRDYCSIADISRVPNDVSYRAVKRVQAKSAHNKRQRSITKGWLTPEQASDSIPDTAQKPLTQPFVQLYSTSTKQAMRLYIQHQPEQASPVLGVFNRYGLSNNTTIPWF